MPKDELTLFSGELELGDTLDPFSETKQFYAHSERRVSDATPRALGIFQAGDAKSKVSGSFRKLHDRVETGSRTSH